MTGMRSHRPSRVNITARRAWPSGRRTAPSRTCRRSHGRASSGGSRGLSRPEEITANQAEIARLETRRPYLQQQLQLVTVLSPAAGVVATARLKERVGEHVSNWTRRRMLTECGSAASQRACPTRAGTDAT